MTELPDFHDANMALLKKYQPGVWQMMIDKDPEPVGSICQAPNGALNLAVTNEKGETVLLHKETDPAGEANDFLTMLPGDDTGFVALLGMGLGYAALGILEQRPLIQNLAFFELDAGIFGQALRYMDLSALLNSPKLILGIGTDTPISAVLAPASRTLQLEGSRVLHHLPSFAFDPAGYKALKAEVFSHLNALNVGGTTTKELGRDFLSNRFKHITTIHHHLLLEQLYHVFAGVPAIMVSGGPSLDKNIHLLKQAQNNAVILAVDTVLPALLEHGVTPHFVTSIDPNNLTYEKFADVIPQVQNTSLICASWVNSKTPQNFPAQQTFWTFTGKPMEAWLNSLLGGKLFTGGASTVAHLNLVACDILGCDPIIFLGQDLAFPKKASHAQGTVLQGSAPTDTLSANNTEGQVVKGIDGTMLQTNRSFLSMKQFFESAIGPSDKKYINATEGGAHIEGTEVLTLQEAIDTYCPKDIAVGSQLQEQIKAAQALDPGGLLAEFSKTLKEAKKLQKIITDADKLCASVRRDLQKTMKMRGNFQSFKMLPPKTQKSIEKIDALHKKLDSATKIWRILEEITMAGLQQSERQRQAIAVLENDSVKYSEWLRQNLTRLLNINKVRQETLSLLTENLTKVLSFHKQEKDLSSNIDKGVDRGQNRLELARLYMAEGSYSLARPIVAELQKTIPQSAEILFFQGCIKALRSEFGQSAECFREAIKLEPALAQQVDEFRQKLGDEFMGYARYFGAAGNRRPSVIYMVKKGLKFAPQHGQLLQALAEIMAADMEQGQKALDDGNNQEAVPAINAWYLFLQEKEELSANISPELVGKIYLNHGRLLIKEERYSEAIADFKKGLEYSSNNDNLNRYLIDILFETGDFDKAVEALNNAIVINNEFAAYWEIIGDSLQADSQLEDAILAYERGFTYLPENLGLLKKIGDCYQTTGQLEAARAAYQQVKDAMVKLAAANDHIQ